MSQLISSPLFSAEFPCWKRGLFTIREQGTTRQNLLIAMAGPCMNLLLIGTEPWFRLFSLANLCFALANLLPIEGSDGLRIAQCWYDLRNQRRRQIQPPMAQQSSATTGNS